MHTYTEGIDLLVYMSSTTVHALENFIQRNISSFCWFNFHTCGTRSIEMLIDYKF